MLLRLPYLGQTFTSRATPLQTDLLHDHSFVSTHINEYRQAA